jgi:electron transfer flavoprotein beta subunit
MKIAVCVKQVPDSWAEKKMSAGLLDRAGVDAVLNDLDEYAVEEALRLVEKHSPSGEAGEGSGHSITIISMGPDRATEAIRKALSMGADDAILISDPALSGSDALATSLVLARIIEREKFELVLCGTESTDARMSVVPAMLAERLNFAQLTFAGSLEVDPSTSIVKISRSTDAGIENMEAALPAIVSVIEKINEPRYPSFKGIMASKKKPIATPTLADLGIDASSVGLGSAWSKVNDAQERAARAAGIKVIDEGNGGKVFAEFLAEKRVI